MTETTAADGHAAPTPLDPPADAPGLTRVVVRAWPLLASILLLMVGSGLQGSLLGVRAEAEGFNATATGFVLGLYFLGYVAGSMWVPRLIRSVGHIRVFASLTSMASAAVVIHGVWLVPVPWMLLRFLTGVCVSGLFIVSESWLNDVATPTTRGTLLAIYNSVVSLGLAVGSLLLNTADALGITLFVVGSVLLSMAAVPVALAPHDAPPPREHDPRSLVEVIRGAPVGVYGSFTSGLTVGAALGFGAVYASRAGFGVSGASQFVATLLVGAVIGQVPLGRWSDRTDRRRVIAVAGTLVAGGGVIGIAATDQASFPLALAAAFVIGAGGFALYGLSFAHVADYLAPSQLPATGARIVTVNGIGAALGPFLASAAIGVAGPEGLFHVLVAAGGALAILVLYRLTRREAVSDERRSHYAPLATSATVAVLDDVVSEVAGVEFAPRRRRIPMPRPRARGRATDRD